MLFPAQRSNAIEKADEPVSLIANLIANVPDFVELEFPSLNHLVTREWPSRAPKS